MYEYIDQIKSVIKTSRNALLNLSEIEIKVLDATTNEPWGPTSTEMREIARASHSYHNFPLIMGIIWKRLADESKWRHVYKGLVLLEYLIKLGSDQVIREARAHIMDIQFLCEYKCSEEENTDVGASVREKARNVSDLLHDEERIKREREKARQSISKYMSYESSETFNRYSSGSSYDSEHYRPPRDRAYEEEYNRSSTAVRSSSSSSPNLSRASTSRAGEQQKKAVAAAPAPDLLNISDLLSTPPANTNNNVINNGPLNFNNNNINNNNTNTEFPAFEFNFPKPVTGQSTSLPNIQPITPPSLVTSSTPPVHLSNEGWGAFEETNLIKNNNTTTQASTNADPNDPWAHKNLFDFGDLNKNSSTNQKTKTPIGALTGAAVKPQMTPTTIYPSPFVAAPVYGGIPTQTSPFVMAPNHPVGNVAIPPPQNNNAFNSNAGMNRPNSAFGF